MSLHLVELLVQDPADRDALTGRARAAVEALGGRLVEAAFASDLDRFYAIVDGVERVALAEGLRAAGVRFGDLAPVRLVGEAPREGAQPPSHLVEWDLPADLKMDQYLKRKAERSPLYSKVPEVRFVRTYVREDMVRCVCLYEAPDEEAVRRAREAVGAPVDRLSRIARGSDGE